MAGNKASAGDAQLMQGLEARLSRRGPGFRQPGRLMPMGCLMAAATAPNEPAKDRGVLKGMARHEWQPKGVGRSRRPSYREANSTLHGSGCRQEELNISVKTPFWGFRILEQLLFRSLLTSRKTRSCIYVMFQLAAVTSLRRLYPPGLCDRLLVLVGPDREGR